MIQVVSLVVGIVAAAALDRRLGWGTMASVAVALYCHRLYRRPMTTLPSATPPSPDDEELRPGWAARWLPSRSPVKRCCECCSGEEPKANGQG
jgi:hypothetical protein